MELVLKILGSTVHWFSITKIKTTFMHCRLFRKDKKVNMSCSAVSL